MCVCLCVSVLTWDIQKGRSYRTLTHTQRICILYNNTHFRHLCVCSTWDIQNGRSCYYASYTVLKSFAWRITQTAYWAYTTCSLREKVFASFAPVVRRIPCTHCYNSSYPGRMNLAHYKKVVKNFPRVCVEVNARHITGTIVAIAFYMNGLYM